MYRIFLRNDPIIVSLAERYKVTTTQVVFAWHLSRNTIILPQAKIRRDRWRIPVRSTNRPSHLFFFSMTYRIILDPTLSEEDLGKILGLDHGQRLGLDADPTTGQAFGWTLEEIGWETYPPKF